MQVHALSKLLLYSDEVLSELPLYNDVFLLFTSEQLMLLDSLSKNY